MERIHGQVLPAACTSPAGTDENLSCIATHHSAEMRVQKMDRQMRMQKDHGNEAT
jgi:hypothetical protein